MVRPAAQQVLPLTRGLLASLALVVAAPRVARGPARACFPAHSRLPTGGSSAHRAVTSAIGSTRSQGNEARLAAVIGHELVHSTHEHTWRQQQCHKKKRLAIVLAAAVAEAYGQYSLSDLATLVNSGHQRALENQSDRVGLQYMIASGYDPREAPRVWKLMTQRYGLQTTDFFWSSHENQATRRSYLMNELKNNYRDLDYSTLTTNVPQFERIRAAVAESTSGKKKIKVTQ